MVALLNDICNAKYRVPNRSENREKVGNFLVGREVGEKHNTLKNVVVSGKSIIFVLWPRYLCRG